MKKLLFLLFFFPVISGYSQNLDIRLLRDINLHRNTHLDGTFRTISATASPFAFGTPVILYGIGLINKDKDMKDKALYIGATVITSTVIATILKNTVKRERPFNTYPDIQKETSGGGYSFPSGHTSDAFSLATSVTLAYPKWYIIVPAYVWAGAVGYSRMDLGVHYPSDVLMGAVTGAGSAYLCYKGQQWLHKKKKKVIE
jgi:membrane-associated phospholipid phosphatase